MQPLYERFSAAEFLTDDDFVNHQLAPTPQSILFWEEWGEQHPDRQGEWQQAVELLAAIRFGLDDYAQTYLPEETIRQLLIRIQLSNARLANPPVPRRQVARLRWVAAASVVALMSVGGWRLTHPTPSPYEQQLVSLQKTVTEHVNTTQQTKLVHLPDQSIITLSPDSRVSYPVDFGQTNRTVYLQGEATFEVTKDATKPFLVHANELTTRVIGTRFVVRAFAGEDSVRVQVESGRVSVYPNQSAQRLTHSKGVLLLPNQQVVFRRESEQFDRMLVQEPRLLPAPSRRKQAPAFVYADTPMTRVLADLSDAYGIEIHYNSEALANCQLTSSMANESFDDKLNIICTTIGATYTVIDGQVIINGGNCQSP